MKRRMSDRVARKVRELSADYERVAGSPFEYFFCPLLYRDDVGVELCEAHVINRAFRASTAWTVQRKDVDGFFGSHFEADFLATKDKGRRIEDVIADPALVRRYRPKLELDGQPVEYYVPAGPVPREHTALLLDGPAGRNRIALKLPQVDAAALTKARLEVGYSKDIRVAALVSLLKAAHLTMFRMVGYEYALSPAGRLLGAEVLGRFFLANERLSRAEVRSNAVAYFRPLAHMMRPVAGDGAKALQGAVDDDILYLCLDGQVWWGAMVLVRTSPSALAAVLVPLSDHPKGMDLFRAFLERPGDEEIVTQPTVFRGDHWETAPGKMTRHLWPKTGLLYPDEED